MSSPSASTDADGRSSRQSSSSTTTASSIAFLVHSPHTLNENLPPEVDNKTFARQKRRRTSPQDQRILEQEFARNPRPSKTHRLDIVRQVSLGEKEVQIWFQNRRQNSRKKAKLSISQTSSSSLSSDSVDQSDISSLSGAGEHTSGAQQVLTPTSLSGASEKNDSSIAIAIDSNVPLKTQSAIGSSQLMGCGLPEESQPDISSSQSSQLPFSSQQSTTSGYLANRRITTAPVAEEDMQPQPLPGMKGRTHVRSSSYLRLSMTDDGKAKVVDRGIPSPSPSPEKQHVSPLEGSASLRRRYTTTGTTDKPSQSIADTLGRTMRASAVGRSRDSRTWEFWCDSDARNSLIERAEQEASGSAAEAIGLIRSSSSRALKFNMRKVNTPPALQAKGCEPMKVQKPTLRRSSTHAGAVVAPNTTSLKRKTGKMGKKDYTAEDFEHLNSESDKENCDPKPSRRPRARRPAVAPRNVDVLGENTRAASQASVVGATMPIDRRARSVPQSTPICVDAEVSAFMSGGSSAAASTGEELDCVQSLLSLSQGNWA